MEEQQIIKNIAALLTKKTAVILEVFLDFAEALIIECTPLANNPQFIEKFIANKFFSNYELLDKKSNIELIDFKRSFRRIAQTENGLNIGFELAEALKAKKIEGKIADMFCQIFADQYKIYLDSKEVIAYEADVLRAMNESMQKYAAVYKALA
jgi:hypothetical protein